MFKTDGVIREFLYKYKGKWNWLFWIYLKVLNRKPLLSKLSGARVTDMGYSATLTYSMPLQIIRTTYVII